MFSIKEWYSSFIVNLDGLILLQMSMDLDSLKIEPKQKTLTGTMNVLCVDFLNHQKDHQFLLMLCRPIKEAVVLVQLEENE